GQARDGVVAAKERTLTAYDTSAQVMSDQLFVSMSAPDRVMFCCSPVGAAADMKIRLSFKLPLESSDGVRCTMSLPVLKFANFTPPKRHRINIESHELPETKMAGLDVRIKPSGYQLCGIVRTSDQRRDMEPIRVRRGDAHRTFASPDITSVNGRYIVEQIKEITSFAPSQLSVVIDSSEALRHHAGEIKQALSVLGSVVPVRVYFSSPGDPVQSDDAVPKPRTVEAAAKLLIPQSFIGGQDNSELLVEALETAAEKPESAVLWLHGPQPTVHDQSEITSLDLIQPVCLYDLALEPGEVSVLHRINGGEAADKLSVIALNHKATVDDVQALVSDWLKGAKKLAIARTVTAIRPNLPIISDRAVSAEVSCLWARDQVTRLLANGQKTAAIALASKYQIVTPVTGMYVSQNRHDYRFDQPSASGAYGAVDPRYGQSNEVGSMADFGYDTARDISRIATALSLLISIVFAIAFLRSRKSMTMSAIVKAATLVVAVPIIVHLMGTFMINNFGGLGGGL
ncbi:MAG TPA: hypothetical protein V6C72_11915, partial [Chroococcales cyanobacterium]